MCAKADSLLLGFVRAERGYELTFKSPRDDAPSLVSFDQPNFDHVVLFAPSTKSETLNHAVSA